MTDCREDLINALAMWAAGAGVNPGDTKNDLYLLLDKYEITSRCTEIAEVHQDRNEELQKRFLVAKQVQGCTERTLEFYGISVKKILEEIGKTVDDITPDDIRLYMAKRLRIDKVTKVTAGNEIRCLSSFFTYLHTQELISRNPMLKVGKIKKQKTKKEALTDMEVEKLRMVVRDERERAIIEFLLSTGCRLNELVNVKTAELEGDRVLVHGKGEKDRYVYLNARTQLALQQYMKERKDENVYLLPAGVQATKVKNKKVPRSDATSWWKNPDNVQPQGHINPCTIEGTMRKLAKKAGVEQANPHKFRRTCATMALRKGMPLEQVSKMLGHEDISTTQIYLDLSEEDLAAAHKKYVI